MQFKVTYSVKRISGGHTHHQAKGHSVKALRQRAEDHARRLNGTMHSFRVVGKGYVGT